jgi:hypothetical protein
VTFRTKLLLVSSITVAGAVALVTGAVSMEARQAFERADGQRRADLLAQLRMELHARGAEVVRQVERAGHRPEWNASLWEAPNTIVRGRKPRLRTSISWMSYNPT